MFYTYILPSVKDKGFYTGFTKNLKLRFELHNKGLVESTKDRRPFKLIYYEACLGKDDAIRREKYFMMYHEKMFFYWSHAWRND
jgi:putative endonuclease